MRSDDTEVAAFDPDGSNWAFSADGMNGSVYPTSGPVDGDTVFATFTQARDGLAEWFRQVSWAYRDACDDARKLRKASVLRELRRIAGSE